MKTFESIPTVAVTLLVVVAAGGCYANTTGSPCSSEAIARPARGASAAPATDRGAPPFRANVCQGACGVVP
jgi:hypothetical protein